MSWAAARHLLAALHGEGDAADEPLHVEYRRIQAMTRKGNRRVRIDPDGKVFVDIVTRDGPRGVDWIGPWPAETVRVLAAAEMRRLRTEITDSGFLELPARIERAGHDGYRDEIDVVVGERRHSVTVERAEPPAAFARVQRAILAVAGLHRDP